MKFDPKDNPLKDVKVVGQNRPIKFRAWDGEKMYEPNDVIIYLGKAWLENLSLDATVLHVKDASPLEAMQFTGLLDKNGKEIYEGDIVLTEHGHTQKIEWEQAYDGDDRAAFYRSGFVISGDPEKSEIIGNIYENSDLLT